MHGGVEEWCLDHYAVYSSESRTDPIETSGGRERVARGGNILLWAYACRSAMRRAHEADATDDTLGLRIVIAEAH